ncbi:MAG: peptidoglycan DD-metalloendopeptidase family protein [Bacteroidia bacterium]
MKRSGGSILLLLLSAVLAFAQPAPSNQRKELEKKRKELNEKISSTKKVLEETKKKQKTTLSQLKVIAHQIRTREEVINNFQEEIEVLNGQIGESRKTLDTLKADMRRLKEDYAQNILGAYKARNVYDKIMFIFSSKSFNQALKRVQYLNQYSKFRQQQAELILRTQKEIIAALNAMIAIKREKLNLMGMKEAEKKELEQDKVQESVVLTKLQQQESTLKRQLAENERSAKKLNKAISDLIAREIEEARRKEEAEARRRAAEAAAKGLATPKPAAKTSTPEMYLTPEALKLSNDFESNKNNLPWPVEKGYITGQFGTHAHPTLKGVQVNNNGIDITTQPGASVRSIFKGKVKSIFNIPGMGRIVLISHGKYFTAYAKLSQVNVKEGQVVDTRQTIGTVMTNEEEESTEVHLEIWNMSQKQNPQLWLKN